MDALSLLTADHNEVEKHFKDFEKAGDRAYATKGKAVDAMIGGLSVHAVIEELIFYPAARRASTNSTAMVLESLEEHHIVKWVLSELVDMKPTDERFDAKVTVLIENVRHHVKEEEQDLFPKIRDALSEEHLAELGEQLEAAKKIAPTRPHPRSPDTPPGNLFAGLVAGGADKARDILKAVIPKG
ncbi:MAG: hemerythrin domain-containing protein [Actinomycetota bacterium]|nr:hemerythrin domain-containing protein [Actinomycetota bacterium]